MKKRIVSIVGAIVSGKSFSSTFWGTFCGTETVIEELGNDGDVIIYVNSPGGSVFAGFEILNAIKAVINSGRKVDIYICPLAASMASYITTAAVGANVYMTNNAKLMYHAPWAMTWGSKMELRDTADLLEQMENDLKEAISDRGIAVDDDWFATGREKYIPAREAKKLGLIDDIKDVPAEVFNAIRDKSAAAKEFWGSMTDEERMDIENRFKRQLKDGVKQDYIAAKAELDEYLRYLSVEKYGQGVDVKDVGHDSFRVVMQNGESVLLNYSHDPLNIAIVDWEHSLLDDDSQEDGGKKMAGKNKDDKVIDQVDNADDTNVVDDATSQDDNVGAGDDDTGDDDQSADDGGDGGDGNDDADDDGADDGADDDQGVGTGDDETEVADSESEGFNMDSDMIAFAREHYKATRDSHIASIKGCEANLFTDDELNGFSISILGKIAKFANSVAAAKAEVNGKQKAKVDSSIVAASKVVKGTGGSLPPPKH